MWRTRGERSRWRGQDGAGAEAQVKTSGDRMCRDCLDRRRRRRGRDDRRRFGYTPEDELG